MSKMRKLCKWRDITGFRRFKSGKYASSDKSKKGKMRYISLPQIR